MKECPNCKKSYTDDYSFCLDDGFALITVFDSATKLENSQETETQVVYRPSTNAQKTFLSSQWQFFIICFLGICLIGTLLFIFLSKDKSREQNKDTNSNTSNKKSSPLTKSEAEPIIPNNNASPNQIATNPDFTPTGNWSGGNPRNNKYTATANLTENNGEVSGKIVWTLIKKDPKITAEVGSSAIEYVRGFFNSSTGSLLLNGYQKEDPYNMMKLNRYDLTLLRDNRTLSGKTIGGILILRR